MAWPKSENPRYNHVLIRVSDKELAEICSLMAREKISKQEAARRLSFPKVEAV